jgi:hypothetical protein
MARRTSNRQQVCGCDSDSSCTLSVGAPTVESEGGLQLRCPTSLPVSTLADTGAPLESKSILPDVSWAVERDRFR